MTDLPKIDKHVEMPFKSKLAKGAGLVWAENVVAAMEVGDSFEAVPFDDTVSDRMLSRRVDQMRHRLTQYCKMNELPYVFTTRRMPDGSHRIWRTK